MSAAASQVYARQLLSQKLGYPLFIPEPSANLPAQFRRRGVSIGDVGIIMPNGSFNYVFSVCAAADDPVNYLGVPQGFQRIGLDPNLILQWPDMHKKGSELMSASMKKEDIDASGGLKENELLHVPAGVSVGYSLTSARSEAAVLNMPDGAASTDYNSLAGLRSYAIQNAVLWYEFINGTLGLEAPNGSVYCVTGCDKSTTWGIAAVSHGSSSNSLALRFTAAQLVEASATYTYSWETHCPAFVRAGPDFSDERELPQNQCLFLRGFKIMVREGPSAMFGRPAKVTSILGLKSGQLSPGGKSGSFPGAGGVKRSWSKGSSGSSSSGSSGSGQQRMDDSSECWDDDDDDDDDWSSDEELDPAAGVYHPLDGINRYLLEKTRARVAVTHESDWWPLSHGDDLSSDDEMLERLCSYYQLSVEDDGVFLAPTEGSSTTRNNLVKGGNIKSGRSEANVHAKAEELHSSCHNDPASDNNFLASVWPLRSLHRDALHQLPCRLKSTVESVDQEHHWRRPRSIPTIKSDDRSPVFSQQSLVGRTAREEQSLSGTCGDGAAEMPTPPPPLLKFPPRIVEQMSLTQTAMMHSPLQCGPTELSRNPDACGSHHDVEPREAMANAGLAKGSQLVNDAAAKDADKSKFWMSQQTCFDGLSELSVLVHAIVNQREAIELTEDEHPDKPVRLFDLGISHLNRFNRLDELSDLESAIANLRQVIELIDDRHPTKPALLSQLGSIHLTRFQRLGEASDLESAIANQRQAIELTNDGHLTKPAHLFVRGNSQRMCLERLCEVSNLESSNASAEFTCAGEVTVIAGQNMPQGDAENHIYPAPQLDALGVPLQQNTPFISRLSAPSLPHHIPTETYLNADCCSGAVSTLYSPHAMGIVGATLRRAPKSRTFSKLPPDDMARGWSLHQLLATPSSICTSLLYDLHTEVASSWIKDPSIRNLTRIPIANSLIPLASTTPTKHRATRHLILHTFHRTTPRPLQCDPARHPPLCQACNIEHSLVHVASPPTNYTVTPVRIGDSKTAVRRLVFKGRANLVNSMTLSPDDKHIASCSDNTVRIWDAEIGEFLSGKFEAHIWYYRQMASTPPQVRTTTPVVASRSNYPAGTRSSALLPRCHYTLGHPFYPILALSCAGSARVASPPETPVDNEGRRLLASSCHARSQEAYGSPWTLETYRIGITDTSDPHQPHQLVV